MYIEITDSGHGTEPKTISPKEAKHQSAIGYGMDKGSSSYHHSVNDYSMFIQNVFNCDQFSPLSSDDVKEQEDFLPYKAIFTDLGNLRLTNIIAANLPAGIFINNVNTSSGVREPGKSWTLSKTYNVTFDDTINSDGSYIVNAVSVTFNHVSNQTGSLTTKEYTVTQPVSPPHRFHYSNASDLEESSHYVGADGHKITLVNNENAVDPTYKQLVEFIKNDKTNEIPYNNTSFVCSDAAERVHNNAEAIGFRSAWVYVDFTNECPTMNPVTNALIVGHACNLFNTKDKGLVAIDCTGGSRPTTYVAANISLSVWDNEVALIRGGEYVPKLLYSFPRSDRLREFLSMGTIADFYIFW